MQKIMQPEDVEIMVTPSKGLNVRVELNESKMANGRGNKCSRT